MKMNKSEKRVAEAARKHGITTAAQIEALTLQLSRSQSALFCLLHDGVVRQTADVRRDSGVGNISECASALNAKLQAASDARRVICEIGPHRQRFGDRGTVGYWRLVDVQS